MTHEKITNLVQQNLEEYETAVVFFQGAPCSGKTTLMSLVHAELETTLPIPVSIETYERAEEQVFGKGKVSRAVIHGTEAEKAANEILLKNIQERIQDKGVLLVETPGHGYANTMHDYGRSVTQEVMATSAIPVVSVYSLGNAEFYRSKPFVRDRQAFFDEQYGYGGADETIMRSLLENYGLFILAGITKLTTIEHYLEESDNQYAGWPFEAVDTQAADDRLRALDQLRITEEVRLMNNGLVQVLFHYPHEDII